MRKKTHTIHLVGVITMFTLSNLLLVTPVLSAAQENQDVSLNINSYYNWETPDTLSLPRTFVNDGADTWIYKAYDPANINEYIKIYDLRNNGGFSVTLAISDFKEVVDCPLSTDPPPCFGTHTIPYTDVGIVTLANAAQPSSVDTPGVTSFPNSPAGTDSETVYSTLDCDWNTSTDFQTFCESQFQNFTGTLATSDSQTIIDGTSPTGTGRVGQYWLALGMRLRIPQGTVPANYESTFTFSLTPEP
ncbi:hypothetical protein IT413_06165 [Candidatus Peregrinibacteria bacterium]|nr:hypothetical protein [Candidatus Peregrinibacteria bacterium]